MSDVLIDLGAKGTQAVLNLTKLSLEKLISVKGKNQLVEFPETNYYLPLISGLLNLEIKTLDDCQKALTEAESLSKSKSVASGLNMGEGLGSVLNQGLATLICEEILAVLAVLNKEHPQDGFLGFIPDKILRSLGLQLVDGRIAGIAVILGAAKDDEAAVDLIRNFQSKSIVSLLVGNIKGNSVKAQLERKGVELGLENYIVPLGEDYLSVIYAVNFAVRAPLIYGGLKSGQWQGIMDYVRNRVPAFVLLLGHVDEVIVATGLGALAFGLPIITDLDVPQLGKIETTLYEALITEKDYKKLPSKCILARGIKVRLAEVAVPVPYAAAFEGERVRREQLHAEFGGKASLALEYLSFKGVDDVDDGKIELIGPDIDQLEKGSKSMPLAIVVDVYGRKMQKDFEPILERQIHRFVNYAMGIMHIGQRDMNWIRISKDAFSKGVRLKHLGVILHAMLHQEY
ncbi:MAG: CO dehydrogenase/CO-methylating acetyl-CoA synthase complex subunit beta, partial [Candidatus Omnitrophica bacterium]|nr:CO dehydrogenase/CO-methylating acetyl-CoA synthase complex subunit beta [Candidatus Omnitrophota bacterium]